MWHKDYGDVIAQGKKQTLVAFEQFGSYQGDFIVITKDDKNAYIYKDSYGSCSVCDSLEAFENYTDDDNFWTQEKCEEFAKNYDVFITVDLGTFKRLVKEKKLAEILPANTRLEFRDDDYNDLTHEAIFKQIEEAINTPKETHNEE